MLIGKSESAILMEIGVKVNDNLGKSKMMALSLAPG